MALYPPSKKRYQAVKRGTQTAPSASPHTGTGSEQPDQEYFSQRVVRVLYMEGRKSPQVQGAWSELHGEVDLCPGQCVGHIDWCDSCLESLEMRGCLGLPDVRVREKVPMGVSYICRVWEGKALSVSWVRGGHCDRQLDLSYPERPACQMRWHNWKESRRAGCPELDPGDQGHCHLPGNSAVGST